MDIKLVKVDRSNWEECVCLSVSDMQKCFVAPNYVSILLAIFEENLFPMCIYNSDEMVGFLMYGIDPNTKRWELNRLMIGESHQGKGYSKRATKILLKELKVKLGSIKFYTSIVPENSNMKKLVESVRFMKTGDA